MTEPLRTEQLGFKVWRNPDELKEPIKYIGEFHPPAGQGYLSGQDLAVLGLAPGRYTILAPVTATYAGLFSKWQTVVVTG